MKIVTKMERFQFNDKLQIQPTSFAISNTHTSIIFMFGSKINQLNESAFRDRPFSNTPNLPKSSGFKARVASVLLGEQTMENNTNSIPSNLSKDYLISLPPCPYHHEPIRYLCLSPTCTSSTFSICSHPQCRTMHADPDTNLIELPAFNEFIASNCSSLLLLGRRVEAYLKEWKERVVIELDKIIAKNRYIFQNVYMPEVPRLIRQGNYKGLSSAKLHSYVKHDSFENNLQQRLQMQSLGNQITSRIDDFQKNYTQLLKGKHFQLLSLNDIINPSSEEKQGDSPFAMMGKVDIRGFESRILDSKEDFEDICRMLKENRAPSHSSITTIFRASEYGFLAEQFHKKVDGKSPLIILVKTTLGRRFGVFLNLKINQRQQWIPDASGLSFIFSLDRKQSYKLKSQAKSRLKAAFGGLQGPQVGSGCDMYLVDQCHSHRGSGANLGGSYRLPSHLEFGSNQGRAYLAAEENFLVEEYEVFLIE